VANSYRPVAVVTGASSGIGAATVVALGRLGYRIAAGARRLDRVRRVVGESGIALPLDVTNLESIDAFVGEVKKKFGRIDVLVNNAGLASGLNPIDQARDDEWVEMWEVNVLGLMRMTRACLPLIRKARHGHIVNLGSIAGFETYKGGAGYTASKHAVHAISRTLRLELNGEPIRVREAARRRGHRGLHRVRGHAPATRRYRRDNRSSDRASRGLARGEKGLSQLSPSRDFVAGALVVLPNDVID